MSEVVFAGMNRDYPMDRDMRGYDRHDDYGHYDRPLLPHNDRPMLPGI